MPNFYKKHKNKIIISSIAVAVLALPEIAFADNTIESQLDKINTLTTGKLKTVGITGATIGGFLWSIFKGNAKLAGIIIVLGLAMSIYLNWVGGGMHFG